MTIQEIEEKLRRYYDIEEDDEYSMESGCYVNGKWLSICEILYALNRDY